MRKLLMPAVVAVIALFGVLSTSYAASSVRPFVRITEPRPNQCVPGPDVVVHFEAGGVCLAPCGNNLHFKLDDDPFEVQFDGNHPHVFKDVKPGTHTIRVFAANAMHESIPESLAIVTFYVGYSDGKNAPAYGSPMVTYNLPQGEYLGIDAADITIDFMINGCTLSEGGNRAAYYIDGRRFLVYDVCPRHIKELAPGFHTVRVELQDQYGDTIEGPFNTPERTFLVSPDRSVKSPSMPDKYPPLPRIDSIKGSMTMGNPWVAMEKKLPPASGAQKAKAQSLTVRSGELQRIRIEESPSPGTETESISEETVTETTTHSTDSTENTVPSENRNDSSETVPAESQTEAKPETHAVPEPPAESKAVSEPQAAVESKPEAEQADAGATRIKLPEKRTTGTLAEMEQRKREDRREESTSVTVRAEDGTTSYAKGRRISNKTNKVRPEKDRQDKIQSLVEAGTEITSGLVQ